ncbi:MAG: hypothetical protein NZ899_15000, partial [Thermoguttaceae bacterium]|nr:hypothetical protein [Thermoguttaceae bacterium]
MPALPFVVRIAQKPFSKFPRGGAFYLGRMGKHQGDDDNNGQDLPAPAIAPRSPLLSTVKHLEGVFVTAADSLSRAESGKVLPFGAGERCRRGFSGPKRGLAPAS